jgi:hypothetical protein
VEEGSTGTFEGKMAETWSSTTVSTKLGRIAKLAREMPQAALTTLAPSHRHRLAARGVSAHAQGRSYRSGPAYGYEYASNLEENLRSLLERAKSPAAMWRHRFEEYISRRPGMVRKGGPLAYQPSRTSCLKAQWLLSVPAESRT